MVTYRNICRYTYITSWYTDIIVLALSAEVLRRNDTPVAKSTLTTKGLDPSGMLITAIEHRGPIPSPPPCLSFLSNLVHVYNTSTKNTVLRIPPPKDWRWNEIVCHPKTHLNFYQL